MATGAGYCSGMRHTEQRKFIDEARAANLRRNGPPDEAREYARDFHAVFCEACHGIYQAQHGLPNDGHDCPASRALPAQVQALREQLTVIEEARDSQDFEEALTEVERLVAELRAYHA